MFTADIGGLSHVYPYPLFRYFIAFGTVFVFGTIYLVALAFHFAYVAIANIRITSHAPFWIVAVITCILVIFELYSATANAFLLPGAGISIIISGVNAVLFQLLSGLYFVLSKRQVLSTLQKSQGTVKSRAFELRRMTDYLYLAMIPMTYFFVSMALYFLSYSNRDPQILSIVLAVMATGLTEMALVSSFPTNQKKSPRRTEMALESEGRLRSKGDLKTSGNI